MNKLQIEECNYCKAQFNIDPCNLHKYINCGNCNAKYYFCSGIKTSLTIIMKINNDKYELYINYKNKYTEITNVSKCLRVIKIKHVLQINRNHNIENKIKTILSLQ